MVIIRYNFYFSALKSDACSGTEKPKPPASTPAKPKPPAPTSAFHSFPAERERGLAVVSDGRSLEKSLILVLDEFAGEG